MNQDLPEEIKIAVEKITGHEEIISILEKAIVAEPPLLIRDGGFVSEKYDSELDETRNLKKDGTKIIAEMHSSTKKIKLYRKNSMGISYL